MTVQVQGADIVFSDGSTMTTWPAANSAIDAISGQARVPGEYLATNYSTYYWAPAPMSRPTAFLTYYNDIANESSYTHDWRAPHTGGTYVEQPIGAGANFTDTPTQVTFDKVGYPSYTYTGYDIPNSPSNPLPYNPTSADQQAFSAYHTFYYRPDNYDFNPPIGSAYPLSTYNTVNTSAGGWSQREQIWRSETVGTGNRNMILQNECYLGSYATVNSFWYYEPYTTVVVNSQGTLLNTASTGAVSVPILNGDIIQLRINGRRGFLEYSSNGGNYSGVISCSNYNATSCTVNISTASGTDAVLYINYSTVGEDADHTFVKVLKQAYANTANVGNYYSWTSRDIMTRDWNCYWIGQDIFNNVGLIASGPTTTVSDINFDANLKNRIYTTSPMILPNGTRPYSVYFTFTIADIFKQSQTVFFANNGTASATTYTAGYGITVKVNEGSIDNRVSISLGQPGTAAGANVISALKVWELSSNGESVNVIFSWNPADPLLSGRLFVNNILCFSTTVNPLSGGTAPVNTFFNFGALSNGATNGFNGTLTTFSVMPEAWSQNMPQGAISIDYPSNTYGATRNIGALSNYNAGIRGPSPAQFYLTNNAAFPMGTVYTKSYDNYGSTVTGAMLQDNVPGPYTANVVATAGSSSYTFAYNNAISFANNGGCFLVTATGTVLPTANNLYAVIQGGTQSSFIIYDQATSTTGTGNAVPAVVSSTQALPNTFTFTRVAGGLKTGGTTGDYITMPGQGISIATKGTNSAANATNQLPHLSATGVSEPNSAFKQITFTVSAANATASPPFGGIGNTVIQTQNSTANDTAIRNLMNATALGKYFTVSLAGVIATPNGVTSLGQTYITSIQWDFYGTGLHQVNLSQTVGGGGALIGTTTAGQTITCNFIPGNFCTFNPYAGGTNYYMDCTGGYGYADMSSGIGYSSMKNNGQGNSIPLIEAKYGLGQVASYRQAPPKGVYDSGVFKATAATFTKSMYLGYGAIGYLISYGPSGDYNRSILYPNTSTLTTQGQIFSNGINVAVTSGNYYRIVVVPITAPVIAQ
jgi:hypothetical protein